VFVGYGIMKIMASPVLAPYVPTPTTKDLRGGTLPGAAP
jgi:hypothetical protein